MHAIKLMFTDTPAHTHTHGWTVDKRRGKLSDPLEYGSLQFCRCRQRVMCVCASALTRAHPVIGEVDAVGLRVLNRQMLGHALHDSAPTQRQTTTSDPIQFSSVHVAQHLWRTHALGRFFLFSFMFSALSTDRVVDGDVESAQLLDARREGVGQLHTQKTNGASKQNE